MQIAVLAFDGCLGSSVLGPVDMLTLARKMISKRGQPEPYSVSTVSFDGCLIEDGTGRRLDVDASFDEIGECAAILVPGYFCELGHSFPATPAIGAAAAWIRQQHARGAIICGSCNGVFRGRTCRRDRSRCHRCRRSRRGLGRLVDRGWAHRDRRRAAVVDRPFAACDPQTLRRRGGENRRRFHGRRYGSDDANRLCAAGPSGGVQPLSAGSRAHRARRRRHAAFRMICATSKSGCASRPRARSPTP